MTEGAFQASPLRFTQPKTVIPCDLLSIYYRYGELCVIKKALITSLTLVQNQHSPRDLCLEGMM